QLTHLIYVDSNVVAPLLRACFLYLMRGRAGHTAMNGRFRLSTCLASRVSGEWASFSVFAISQHRFATLIVFPLSHTDQSSPYAADQPAQLFYLHIPSILPSNFIECVGDLAEAGYFDGFHQF